MYSQLVERALAAALEAHAGQFRRGEEGVPYSVHAIQVALLLARHAVDEDVVAAGLLHDVVEDCPGWTIERVRSAFGPRTASIVEELTEDKSRSWSERKMDGIARVAWISSEAALVKACDKLHNLECLRHALDGAPDSSRIWSRFRGGRELTLEMSSQLVDALGRRVPGPLFEALRAALAAVEAAH
jgi:(p)ppGpp synthase/HD superfamily hydrolase